jgi:hypothetical protein
MAQLFKGRYAARIEGDFVVFLIGMRIQQLWAVHKWGPVAAAMPRMLRELMHQPELGLLHVHSYWMGRTVLGIQYWRSAEQLHAYANMRDGLHLPAWKAYYRAAANNSAVGVFHETYLIPADSYECIYANMPRTGLAMAGEHVAAVGRMQTMRSRLGQPDGDPPSAT